MQDLRLLGYLVIMSNIQYKGFKMASDKNKKNVEITKEVHKRLSIVKAIKEFKTMDETREYLLKNQKK